MNRRSEKAITLIALVVTIVVLLILAGVSISMLTGENGIITQAQEAKENTRGAEVKEKVEMAANENKMADYATGTKKDKQDVIDELVADKKLTEEEVKLLETEDKITIGNVVIDFSILGEAGTTIGDVYSEEMVGKTINYTSNTALPEGTEWIILGEDKDGSIMLTTSKPIENGFTLNYTAEAWLSYEEDIKEACSIYGATVQGNEVKARSITLEDVNRVTGFIEPEFNTYTFGSTLDYANKQVDFYHPDAESDNFWSKEETTYECDNYYYYIDTNDNSIKYAYEGNDWGDENYTTTTLKNMDIILGENSDYMYLLGSRSVRVASSRALFYVDSVIEGRVRSGDPLCNSRSGGFSELGASGAAPVRPIINLPSNIQVEELNGEWNIVSDPSEKPVLTLESDIGKEELILEYTTTSANKTIELPYTLTYDIYDEEWNSETKNATYTFDVDWGDGTVEKGITNENIESKASHTYVNAGIYEVKIEGTYDTLYYSDGSSSCLTQIKQWGTTGLKVINLNNSKLTEIASPTQSSFKDLSYVKSAFARCKKLTSIPENLFANCPNVIDYSAMFQDCYSLESIPENLFVNCSNARSFKSVFSGCKELTSIPEKLFAYCPNVTNFSSTFDGCEALTNIPEKLFDNCKKVEYFSATFYKCKNVTGNVPKLWTRVNDGEKNGYVGIPDGLGCYYGVTGADNYENIPEYWKSEDGRPS